MKDLNNTHQCTHHEVVSYTDRGVEKNKRLWENKQLLYAEEGQIENKEHCWFSKHYFQTSIFFSSHKKVDDKWSAAKYNIMVFSFSLKIGNKFYLKTKLVFLLFSCNFPETKDCKILVIFCITFLFSVNWKNENQVNWKMHRIFTHCGRHLIDAQFNHWQSSKVYSWSCTCQEKTRLTQWCK